MDVVDAHWERRNLGVTCVEVTVEPGDSVDEVAEVVDGLAHGYQVVKVPTASVGVMHCLADRGFEFLEASVSVEHSLRTLTATPIVARLAAATEILRVPGERLGEVTDRIHRGMFDTDRVYIDAHFTAVQAATRYANWIRDEVDRGAAVYELEYGREPIGFYLFREGLNGTGLSALSGLYDRVNTPGMGLVLLYKILEEGIRRGMGRLSSKISTNNLAVVKTHAALGFSVTDIHYVYVRHREEERQSHGES